MKQNNFVTRENIFIVAILILVIIDFTTFIPLSWRPIIDIISLTLIAVAVLLFKPREIKVDDYQYNVVVRVWRLMFYVLIGYMLLYTIGQIFLIKVFHVNIPICMNYLYWCILGCAIGARVVVWRLDKAENK